jgi:hypothetical protein
MSSQRKQSTSSKSSKLSASSEATPKEFVSPSGATPNSKQWLLERKAFKSKQKAQERIILQEESYKNRLNKVLNDAFCWADKDYKRLCVGYKYDIDMAFVWVSGMLPTYIIEALVYNSFEIDIDSLNRYVSDGLNLADPEAALKKYQSKHQSK